MPITVSELATAPVKGMRLHCSSEVQLGPRGVTGDREFLVVNDDCKLLLTDRNARLLQIEPSWRCGSQTTPSSRTSPRPEPPRLPGTMRTGRYPDGSSPGR